MAVKRYNATSGSWETYAGYGSSSVSGGTTGSAFTNLSASGTASINNLVVYGTTADVVIQTDGGITGTVFTGSTTPSSPAVGDIWINYEASASNTYSNLVTSSINITSNAASVDGNFIPGIMWQRSTTQTTGAGSAAYVSPTGITGLTLKANKIYDFKIVGGFGNTAVGGAPAPTIQIRLEYPAINYGQVNTFSASGLATASLTAATSSLLFATITPLTASVLYSTLATGIINPSADGTLIFSVKNTQTGSAMMSSNILFSAMEIG